MRNLSESIVSFFKVMIDDEFLRVLYLPPKFARTVPDLLQKKAYLETLDGQKWNVVVSKVNGSLAFKKGWSEFSVANNLGIGDLLVFHYFGELYFLVQIFNRSACDVRRLELDSRKRRRYEMNPVDTDGSLRATNQNSAGEQDSPGKEDSSGSLVSADGRNVHIHEDRSADEVIPLTIVPDERNSKGKAEPINLEDPALQFLMIGRDMRSEQSDSRTVIDLSNYEMPNADAKSSTHLAGAGWPLPYADNLVKCKEEPESTGFSNLKPEKRCHVGSLESIKAKEVGRSLYSDDKHKIYNASTLGSPSLPNLFPVHESQLAAKKEHNAEKPNSQFQSGSSAVKIKKEIKTEPFEETGLAFVTASADDLVCPIINPSSMLLELPESLPLFTYRQGAYESKLVILRDTAERVWPVFYRHKPNMKFLTTGWSEFWKANNIRLGDECIFKADTNADATYDVMIVRKEDKAT